jgi:hypothetical protein
VNCSRVPTVLSGDGTPPASTNAGTDGVAHVVNGPGEALPWTLALHANPWLTFHPNRMVGDIGRAGHDDGRNGGRMGHRERRHGTCLLGVRLACTGARLVLPDAPRAAAGPRPGGIR